MPPRRLVANATINVLALVAQFVVSFFLAPVILRALGDARYGIWSFVESFLAYLMLFDLGVAAALVRFVPRCLANQDEDGLNRVFSVCLAFFASVALAAAIVGWLFLAIFADRFLQAPAEIVAEVRLVFLVVVVNFALSLPFSVFPAMLDGLNEFGIKSTTRTVFLVLRIPLLLGALSGDQQLLRLILALALSNLLESLTLAWLVFRRLPKLRFVPRQIDRPTIRLIRGYSFDSFLAMIAGRFSFNTDAFVIGASLGAAAITPFALANRLVDLAKSLLRSATTTLTPVISAFEANGDLDAVRSYFLHGTRIMLYLVLPIQAGLFFFGKSFLALWLGSEYAEISAPTLRILNVTLSLTIAQSVASRVLYGMGRIRLFARVALLEGVANLLLSLALVGSLGIAGVALGTTIPHAAFCLFAIAYAATLLDVSLRDYLRAWAMPLVAAAIFAVVLFVQPTPETWAAFLGRGLTAMIPHAAIVVGFEFHGSLRRFKTQFDKLLRSRRPTLRGD